MKEINMKFNTKQELYEYLNNFDFNSIKDTGLSSVYFLVEFDNHIEPIYFTPFEDVWFGSPCNLHEYSLKENDLFGFVKELYEEDSWAEAYEFEKTMQRDNLHYEIDCPQCTPFLPDEIIVQSVFSEKECLEWLLNQRKTSQSKGE